MSEIAKIDICHLKLIRTNVTKFLERKGSAMDKDGLHVLDVAPQDHEGARAYFQRALVETLDIDQSSGATYIADLCCNNEAMIAANRFDVIVCTEVLEHTLKPFNAVAEMARILKPGGFALVTVPFNLRIHGPLPDCWRFTEHGLRSLFDGDSGFEIGEFEALEDPGRFLMPLHYTLSAKKTTGRK